MRSLSSLMILFALILSLFCFSSIQAQELEPIQLLKPQTDGGKPLMQALKERQSSREFSTEKLPLQVLSNLLWAAFGVNRQGLAQTSARGHQADILTFANLGGI